MLDSILLTSIVCEETCSRQMPDYLACHGHPISMISKRKQALHRLSTLNLTPNRTWAQLGSVRLLEIPCLHTRYWWPSIYERLAPVYSAMRSAWLNTCLSRDFHLACSVPFNAFVNCIGFPSISSAYLPRTRVRTLHVLVRVFSHAFWDRTFRI